MCEWIWELELLKSFLRILSEWFPKHLEIKLSARARGFESHRLRHVGAGGMSPAPTLCYLINTASNLSSLCTACRLAVKTFRGKSVKRSSGPRLCLLARPGFSLHPVQPGLGKEIVFQADEIKRSAHRYLRQVKPGQSTVLQLLCYHRRI